MPRNRLKFTMSESRHSRLFPKSHYHNLTEVAKQFNIEQFTNPYARTKTFELGLNSNPANYVRFIIDSLLPHAKKAMWIDVDTIVKCDVVGMFRQALTESKYVIAAVPVHRKPMGVNGKVLKANSTRISTFPLMPESTSWT